MHRHPPVESTYRCSDCTSPEANHEFLVGMSPLLRKMHSMDIVVIATDFNGHSGYWSEVERHIEAHFLSQLLA